MHVFGPRICNARTMYSIFGQVFDEQGNVRSDRFSIDLRNLADFDVVGAAGLATLIQWLGRQSIIADLVLRSPANRVAERLQKALSQTCRHECDDGGSNGIAIRLLDPETAVEWLHDGFVPWMAEALYVTSAMASGRSRPLKELFANASEHSYCRRIITAAQCDWERQEITCIVADDGIGLPQAVRRVWKEPISDTVAIARAIEAGFTTTETNERSGRGLSRLVEHVVRRCQGRLVVHSGYGIVRCQIGVENFVTRLQTADAFFPGTLFVVVFPGAAFGSIPVMNEPAPEPIFYGDSSE